MLTDWFTVAAQILNFLILVALLKHFLYNRIIGAMTEREQKIKKRMEDAEAVEKEYQRKLDEIQRNQDTLERERKDILQKANEEAAEKKEQLIKAAEKDRDDLKKSWRGAIERDQKKFMEELTEMSVHQVIELSRQMIRELADEDLQSRMINVFITKIKALSDEKREALKTDVKEKPALVMAAFELSGTDKQKITRTLHEELSSALTVRYETDRNLMAGLRIRINDKHLSWNMKDAFKEMMDHAQDYLDKAKDKLGEGNHSTKENAKDKHK